MVVLSRIYTKSGDDGTTGLGSGERVAKDALRVEAFGTVDETNAALGLARLHSISDQTLDTMLARIQNDLFDLGADLCTLSERQGVTPLRILENQVTRIEQEIDLLNAGLQPLRSFVLPGGTALSAALHLARTISRRAERLMVALSHSEPVGTPALHYINRLSDFFFVAARYANNQGAGDVLWVPGQNR